MRKRIWFSMMIGLHTVIHSQVVIHDTVTVCPDTSSLSGHPAHPFAKSEIHFFYEPVYNPCGELTYCRPGIVDGVIDPCGGGCYTFSRDFSEVTYTSRIRSAVIPLINLSESGGSIAFDISRPQSEIGHRIFAYHITNLPDLRVCWGADPTIPPIGTGTLNVAYGERLFFALQEDVYSPGHIPLDITPICPYEFMVRFVNPDLTLWVNGFETGMATYEVVPDTDSIAHGTAVPLDVTAWLQLEEGTEEIPETAELDFTFMSGAEYGTYIGPDSLQADTLHNILYRDVKAGRVRFIANGDNPEGSELVIFSVNASGKECPAGAGIAFVQPAAEYSFRVTFEKDTICFSDGTLIFVQAVNGAGENVDPPEGMRVRFELSAKGQQYGSLRTSDNSLVTMTSYIPYADANTGRVRYVADGAFPDSTTQVTVTTINVDDESMRKEADLYVSPLSRLSILNYQFQNINRLAISTWEMAYDSRGRIQQSFLDFDTDRFYVCYQTSEKGADPITVKIWTTKSDGETLDRPNLIECHWNNTNSYYLSKPQILTTQLLGDIEPQEEDDLYSKNGAGEDESLSDATHQAEIGGKVIVECSFSGNSSLTADVDVCPEYLTGEMFVYFLGEPYLDDGYKDPDQKGHIIGKGNGEFDWEGKPDIPFRAGLRSEKYLDVSMGHDDKYRRGDDPIFKTSDGRGSPISDSMWEAHIKRLNIAWAQAGIQFEQITSLLIDNDFGSGIFKDFRFTMPTEINGSVRLSPNDVEPCYAFLDGKGLFHRKDVIYVVVSPCSFIDNMTIYERSQKKREALTGGFACFPKEHGHPFWDKDSFIAFLSPSFNVKWRVLAHEIGHLLSCEGDIECAKWNFFPQYPLPGDDSQITRMRRIQHGPFYRWKLTAKSHNLLKSNQE